MSLRWKVSVALAAVAAIAVALTASVAYALTQDRIYAEVDHSLAERVAPFVGPARGPGGRRPLDARGQGPADRGRDGGGGGDGDALIRSDVEAQILNPQGQVTSRSGDVSLAVTSQDKALAASGTGSRTVNTSADGVPYRVLTVGLNESGALQLGRDLSEAERVLDALRNRLLLVGFASVAIAAAAGWLVARQTAKPLEALTTTAERVAQTGDLTVAVLSDRSDEAGRLARAFASMLDALSQSKAQQRQLVQDASHELRTPLTSLRTNLDVLGRHGQDLSVDQHRNLFADLHSELGELTTLVNELVMLAGDERATEEAETISLNQIVARLAERAARRHQRHYVLSVEPATVVAHPSALDRAVTNLLDNAAKFSPAGTTIEVQVRGGEVAVRDQGAGISPEDLPRIFDRFYRATASRTMPGSGLGLAIVRQIVEADGGEVFAHNAPGGGAVVGFRLPLEQVAPG